MFDTCFHLIIFTLAGGCAFPLETRALAIAGFYVLGTAIGGSISPLLFRWLIESGSAWRVSFGYGIAARADASRGPY
jgi:hypothetical protein